MFEQAESKGKADNIDKLVSRRLKMRRVMLGMSQQDIGKAVDVSIQQVQKYEKATNRISSGKLFTIAKFLKVPITYFYEHSDESEIITNVFAEDDAKYEAEDSNAVTEKEIVNLIKAFSRLKVFKVEKRLPN